jgi:LPS-assembly protein
MKKSFPTLLASLIWSALYSQQALADFADQCLLGVPAYTKPLVTGKPDTLPVHIQADHAKADNPTNATFTGNVDIVQGNSTLTAKQAQLDQNGDNPPVRTVTATGDVHYNDNQIKLNGPKAVSNLNTKDTDVYQGNYQMVGRQGRGDADTMKLRGNNRYTVLENGTFTSCLPGNDSWSVKGSQVIHDRDEQVAEIYNARFRIDGVPVFYSPYMQFPVGNTRRSGFLIPNMKYGSTNGFEFSAPYYFNLAPNYDDTLTPNYMSKRGLQLQNEFRYLTAPGAGLFEFDFLPNDSQYANETGAQSNSDRWLMYWRHNGVMDQVWRFNVDYTRVSDPLYFNDLTSKYGNTTDGYATQKFSVGYADEHWDTALSYKEFQVFSDYSYGNDYRAAPQLDLTYYQNDVGPFDTKIVSQVVKFTSVNSSAPNATRVHIEPTVDLPLSNRWGSLDTETKLMATHYQQENIDTYNDTAGNHQLQATVNRVMPQFKTDGKMVFERPMDWSQGYTQTLEPRMQYLYVPYRNQSDINIYDSTLLQTDYTGLFHDRSYTGLDRIASANQLAAGATTRIYDDGLVERFNASLGQIYYFTPPRTGDANNTLDNNANTGSVVWAGDSYWRIDNQWAVRGGIQYDTRLTNVSLGDAVLEYRPDANRLLQLSYRFASPEYIQAMLPDITSPGYQQGISQVGTVASWPLVDRWSVVGAYYYDIKENQPAEQRLGLQYNTCCWAVNVSYERKITGWNSTSSTSTYDDGVSLNIELRGLSSDYGLGAEKMLASGILPYQRAF